MKGSMRAVFVFAFAAVILLAPTLALSSSLTPISVYGIRDQDQPSGFLETVADLVGMDMGSLMQGWVAFDGTNITGIATSYAYVLTVLSGDTQTATDRIYWTAIYELDADPGVSAAISVDFESTNMSDRYELGDTFTESTAMTRLSYLIVPAADTGNYVGSANDAMLSYFDLFGWVTDPPHLGDYSNAIAIDWDKHVNGQGTVPGSSPLGLMSDGDRLFVFGSLVVQSVADTDFPGGTAISVTGSGLEANLIVTDPSAIPEPTSLLLLGTGLGVIGLAAWRRRE